MKQNIKKTVYILIFLSLIIYTLQIIIFRDPRNTFFYIFQDLAFMPITIAIATLVVGEVLSQKEKEERVKKTRMLTSTFFTEIGNDLTRQLLEITDQSDNILSILSQYGNGTMTLSQTQDHIKSMSLSIALNEKTYSKLIEKIQTSRSSFMTLSSNPLLFDHEDFTRILWAIFHVMDEYQLRGTYQDMSQDDISHLNKDYAELLRLLLICFVANAKYLEDTYPNFYQTFKTKLPQILHK